MTEPLFIDLDAIEVQEVTIGLNGKKHPVRQITLEDWIANTKESQRLKGAEPDLETESDVIISMIARSIPTLSKEELRGIPLSKLNRLLEFTNGANGSERASQEAKAVAVENPPVTDPAVS